MKQLIRLILLGLITVVATGYAASSKDAFIHVDKKTLKKEYSYLAIAPLESAASLHMPESVRDMIEAEVVKRLKKEGFNILPPKAMREIREHMRELVGLTELPDENDAKKLAAIHDHSHRELLLRHKVDGVVSLRARVVGAPFMKDKTKWDNTSQKIKHKGDGLMKFITGKGYGGTIAASSLKVSIWDRRDRLLYSWSGGIEVLMQRNGKALEKIPATQFWQDEKRIKNSVKLALSPL